MPNMNVVVLIGRLTRDPELRHTPQGSPVCDIGLATSHYRKDKAGQLVEEPCFIEATVWGHSAEAACTNLRKGSPVAVFGRIVMDCWEQDGKKRTKHKIAVDRMEFLGAKVVAEMDMSHDERKAADVPPPVSTEDIPF